MAADYHSADARTSQRNGASLRATTHLDNGDVYGTRVNICVIRKHGARVERHAHKVFRHTVALALPLSYWATTFLRSVWQPRFYRKRRAVRKTQLVDWRGAHRNECCHGPLHWTV